MCDVDLSKKRWHWPLERQVASREGATLARKLSADIGRMVPFLETSAKEGTNVKTAFGGMATLHPSLRQVEPPTS